MADMIDAEKVAHWRGVLDGLREEFIVCYAAGYDDPHTPHPNTLENARQFAADGARPGRRAPVVKRRYVTGWEEVVDDG